MKTIKKIGTHSGIFHADDATALMMLVNYTKEFKGSEIYRSRDKKFLDAMDLVVDVGGVYDPKINRYDHHQKGFEETFNENFKTKLSGSGLIYKHFGKEIIKNSLEEIFENDLALKKYKIDLKQDELDILYVELYQKFFECLDGVDNGIERYPKDVKPNYRLNHTSLVDRVSSLNPSWWEDSTEDILVLFKRAMKLTQIDFLRSLTFSFAVNFISKAIVQKAFDKRLETDESGEIVYLEKACFWKESVFKIEEQMNLVGKIKYVLFQSRSDNSFRVQCVPVELGSFSNRWSLKKEWRGLDLDNLRKVSNIEDIVFCHHSGFIGGARSFKSALNMAVISLNEKNN